MTKTFIALVTLVLLPTVIQAADPLSSWNDTAPKQAIVSFVEKVTKEGSTDFVPPSERIAVFDNDGCLWSEQPMYFQAFFVFDRIKALAPQHPEWKEKEPFSSVLNGDMKTALAGGEHALLVMVMATHAGMTTEEFEKSVTDWLATAKHPKTGKPFTEMVYQPMLELLAYLRANGFKTFIVSGGGIEFMRPWTQKVYGITLNTENNDTNYQSGSAFHIDASVQQLLPLGPGYLGVGFNAFYYEQIQGDSGSSAKLGGFEGRTVGIGPALGYILPVGENTLVAEVRWLPELDTKRRLEGDFFWLKLVYQF